MSKEGRLDRLGLLHLLDKPEELRKALEELIAKSKNMPIITAQAGLELERLKSQQRCESRDVPSPDKEFHIRRARPDDEIFSVGYVVGGVRLKGSKPTSSETNSESKKKPLLDLIQDYEKFFGHPVQSSPQQGYSNDSFRTKVERALKSGKPVPEWKVQAKSQLQIPSRPPQAGGTKPSTEPGGLESTTTTTSKEDSQ